MDLERFDKELQLVIARKDVSSLESSWLDSQRARLEAQKRLFTLEHSIKEIESKKKEALAKVELLEMELI